MCPLGGSLVGAQGSVLSRGRMICHCLLIETDAHGLVLVDTGFGTADIASPNERIGRAFMALSKPSLDPHETAIGRVKSLGFRAEDVRHILLTHMDLDHAGGLGDFPHAKVHVLSAELSAALARDTLNEKGRYKPTQWAHNPDWSAYVPSEGDRWKGFACVRDLTGLPPEILMVPLTGHTRGHAAIAVQDAQGWLMHCGDSYFYHGEMEQIYRCPAGLKAFQRTMAYDRKQCLDNQARLRELVQTEGASLRTFSAHDPVEYERLTKQ